MVQLHVSTAEPQAAWVRPRVGELTSHMSHDGAKRERENEKGRREEERLSRCLQDLAYKDPVLGMTGY